MIRACSALAGLFLLLAGCAGQVVERPDPANLVLGKTTAAEVIRQMGPPTNRLVATFPSQGQQKPVQIIGYSNVRMASVRQQQAMYFYQDVLVGESFVTQQDPAKAVEDERKIASIVKGRTTRQEVLALMGRPSGRFIPPVAKEPSAGETWQYDLGTGTNPDGHRLYRIRFDAGDVVSEVDAPADLSAK